MDAIVHSAAIMDGASALDWRVLHAIEVHQGYKTWRCQLSLDRIAKVARCSRKAAGNASRWWAKMGVLKITRTGMSNVFEIIQDFRSSPERVHGQRHISRKSQKRGPRGRFAPSTAHQSPRSTAHQSPPCDGHITRSLEREVFNESPPLPPTGGRGRTSETSGRPALTLSISDDTIRKLMEIKTREEVIEILKKGGYPVPSFLQGQAQDPGPDPGCKSAASPVMNPDNGPDHQGKSTDSPSVAGEK
jgi:hypothetical protein